MTLWNYTIRRYASSTSELVLKFGGMMRKLLSLLFFGLWASPLAFGAIGDTLQGPVELKAVHSGKCIDVAAASKEYFAKVQQWDCNGTNAQKFRFNDVGAGWFEIQNINSDKCLDAKGGSKAQGTEFVQYKCGGAPNWNQHFKFKGDQLIVRHDPSQCLNIGGKSKESGKALTQWKCGNKLSNQSFKVVKSGGGNGGGGSGGGNEGGNGPGNNGRFVRIKVRNQCPMPLWVHTQSAQGVLQPDNMRLGTGEERSWESPNHAISGRVEFRRDANLKADAAEKVEYTFIGNPVVLNYNLTYVDFYGLPVSVTSTGKGSDCKKSTCDQPLDNFFKGCPAPLWDGQRCISPRTFCLDAKNQGNPYCNKLDAKIDECVNRFGDCAHARGAKTPEAFACSGRFSEDPKNCAAINRNMLDDRESADKGKYYKNQPYNDYAKWSHEKCPNIYAFSYDDYPMNAGTSGFHACADGSELSIVTCPKG